MMTDFIIQINQYFKTIENEVNISRESTLEKWMGIEEFFICPNHKEEYYRIAEILLREEQFKLHKSLLKDRIAILKNNSIAYYIQKINSRKNSEIIRILSSLEDLSNPELIKSNFKRPKNKERNKDI